MKASTRLVAPALFLLLLPPLLASGCRGDGAVEPAAPGDGAPLLATARYSEWSAPINLGPTVNSAFDEQTPALSPDGLSLYFLSSRPGGVGLQDLWVTRRASRDGPWGTPENLGPTVNSGANEGAPFLSRDGHRLYFVSSRPGGFGDFDIMMSWRAHTHDDFAWEAPINIGPPANTAMFEGGMTIHGPEFYFSRGLNVGVPHDIYLSRMSGDVFADPEVVAELSSAADERRPTIRFDGREIYFHSNRPGGQGLTDLWTSTRAGNGTPWTTPVNLGPGINTPSREQTPAISADGTILVFVSDRAGGSGALDLYYVTRSIGGPK
jgi:Tol biopolymer transport system component